MSVDKDVTENVMEILEDGRDGFTDAAEKLRDTTWSHLAPKLQGFAAQRARFYTELETMAAAYGDDVEESGSVRAVMHRAWMSVKDALSGDDPEGVLEAAVSGENYAVKAYEDALEHEISPNLRTLLQRQYGDVKQTRDEIKALSEAAD